MATLNSASALIRARAQLGQPDGAGACLANVYKWFGSVQSIGPGSGHYDWAIKGWNYTPDSEKHAGDWNPPAGVPVYFAAVGAPRWGGDRNYPCGDIGLSIGGGYAIFTDSPTGNTGIMSLSSRAAQIGRPYLGWTESFLGHQTTAGVAFRNASKAPVIVKPAQPLKPTQPVKKPTPKKEISMLFVKSKKSGSYYNIGEFSVDKVTKARANTYSAAVQGEGNLYVELSSDRVSALIDDARKRRDALGLRVSDIITAALAAEDAPTADD